MSIALKRIPVKNITDEYIRENIDEILEIMLESTGDKQKKGNWKRALKTEGASKNITYLGFAITHKICKRTEKMWDRIDSIYEKEAMISESIRESQEHTIRNQKALDEFRAIQYKLIEKLKSHMKNYEYGEFVQEELSQYNRGYYGF